MSNCETSTSRPKKPSPKPRQRLPKPANTNAQLPGKPGRSRAPAASPTPRLTPALAMAVLREITRKDGCAADDVVEAYVRDNGYSVVAAVEATAALERAGAVRPLVDAFFAQLSCWSRAPYSDFAELRALYDDPHLRAVREVKHTIYALLGGAYFELDHHDDAAIFEELADRCLLLAKASDHPWVQLAGGVASWMVSMVTYPLTGGTDMDRRTCLHSTSECACLIANHLAEHAGDQAFETFIASLRAIAAPASRTDTAPAN